MMLSESKIKKWNDNQKVSWDIRAIGWLYYLIGAVLLVLSFLLLSGFGKIPSDENRLILMGMISLTSEVSYGIHNLCMGIIALICGYGIIRRFKFVWWLMLIYSINGISDSLFVISLYPMTAIISICLSIGIIFWLIYRRKFYGIGLSDIDLN